MSLPRKIVSVDGATLHPFAFYHIVPSFFVKIGRLISKRLIAFPLWILSRMIKTLHTDTIRNIFTSQLSRIEALHFTKSIKTFGKQGHIIKLTALMIERHI